MSVMPLPPHSPIAHTFAGGTPVCYSSAAYPLRLIRLPVTDAAGMIAHGLEPIEARIGDTPIGLTWSRADTTPDSDHVVLDEDADQETAIDFADLLADDLDFVDARSARHPCVVYEGDCRIGFVVRVHASGLLDLELVADPVAEDEAHPDPHPLTLAQFSHVRLPAGTPPTRGAAEHYAMRRLAALLAGYGREGAVDTPWSDLQ